LEFVVYYHRVTVYTATSTSQKYLSRLEILTMARVKKVRKNTVSYGFRCRSYRLKNSNYKKPTNFGFIEFYI